MKKSTHTYTHTLTHTHTHTHTERETHKDVLRDQVKNIILFFQMYDNNIFRQVMHLSLYISVVLLRMLY